MRVQSVVVLAGILCLLTTAAFADIVRVAPTELDYATEDFLNIYGTNLVGSVSTEVVFDGLYAVEPNFAGSDHLLVFVPAGITLEPGQHSIVVRSIDELGVRTHGPATFTVRGLPTGGRPLLSLPEGVIAEAESARGANVAFVVSAVSPNGDPVDVSCSHESGALFPLGVTSVQCSATNADGTTASGFFVVVTDTVAPELTVPDDITSSDPVVTFTATATDAVDGALAVTCNPPSGSSFGQGNTTVRCFAVDAHANRVDGSFRVRITGQGSLVLPDDIEAEATSAAGAVVTFVATDDGGSPAACSPASGSTFPVGTTAVTCTAGAASGSFNVTVVDSTPPALTLPSIVEAEATSPAGANVSWVATATDLVSGELTIECFPLSGSLFPLGTTGVACQATDGAGNTAAGSFDVIVSDTTPPAFTTLTVSPSALWPPNHKLIDVQVTAVAVDTVDPAPAVQILSVTSNQPDNGTGDGDTAGDIVRAGPFSLKLRAERSGGKERIYTILLQATDASGNVTTETLQVKVAEPSKRRSVRP